MKIKLLDYQNNPSEHDIGSLDDVVSIDIEIISGDEVMSVKYKDGHIDMYDSCDAIRAMDFHDGFYTIYEPATNTNLLNDKTWLNRTDSYSY